MIFVGVDWAEAHHDVHVADEEGRRLSKGRLPEGVEGIARFHELVGAHVEDPEEVVIGIETDRGLFVSPSSRPATSSTRSTRTRRRAIGSATRRAAPSPTPATRTCSPTSCAPTATTTGSSPPTGRGRRDQGPRPGAPDHDLVQGPPGERPAIDIARVLPGRAPRL